MPWEILHYKISMIMTDSVMTAPPGKKWHPSQEGDLNMNWHENQDSSSGRTPG